MMDYFLTKFGLNPLEVTALREAHTLLGQANIFNSGYNGPWVSGETSVFNSKYYSNMVRGNGVTWRLTQRDCANINGVNTNQMTRQQAGSRFQEVLALIFQLSQVKQGQEGLL